MILYHPSVLGRSWVQMLAQRRVCPYIYVVPVDPSVGTPEYCLRLGQDRFLKHPFYLLFTDHLIIIRHCAFVIYLDNRFSKHLPNLHEIL
jgi:hypothetical protein